VLAFRIIARLDVRNEALIKTIRCEGVRRVGNPNEFAERYDAAGIDEIAFMDVVASLYGRNHLAGIIRRVGDMAFVPLTVFGGVSNVRDMRALLLAGADKVGVNTAATKRPAVLSELAEKIGSQSVVLQLDAKRKGNSWEAYCEGGRQPTGRDAIEWAREAVDRGAGEVLVTSIDCEGVRAGFDLALLRSLSALPVPVVAAGGFGTPPHAVEAWKAGASGIAIAGALHYGCVTLEEIRTELANAGASVRWPDASFPAPVVSSEATFAKP
jgi:cyclase